jgi:predicted transcriptional regulator of viral defense system
MSDDLRSRARPRAAPKETLSVLARAARSGLITVPQAAEALGVERERAARVLTSLAHRGWVSRARRGLYLVLPIEAAGGPAATVDDPWVLAQVLYEPCYIAGWSAAEHWGLTEQLFRSTFVATGATIRERSQRVLGLEFHLVRVATARVAGAARVWRGRERVAVSDPAGTIADALASPSWVGGVRPLAGMLAAYRASAQWDPAALLRRLAAVTSGAAYKRLGYLIEALAIDAPSVVEEALRKRTTGVIRLDPTNPARGRLTKRWGLWVNVHLDVSEGGA